MGATSVWAIGLLVLQMLLLVAGEQGELVWWGGRGWGLGDGQDGADF